MQQLLIIFSYLELIISRYTIIISKWVARISFRSTADASVLLFRDRKYWGAKEGLCFALECFCFAKEDVSIAVEMYSSALRMRSAQQTILMRDTMFFERERNWFAVVHTEARNKDCVSRIKAFVSRKECLLARYEFGARYKRFWCAIQMFSERETNSNQSQVGFLIDLNWSSCLRNRRFTVCNNGGKLWSEGFSCRQVIQNIPNVLKQISFTVQLAGLHTDDRSIITISSALAFALLSLMAFHTYRRSLVVTNICTLLAKKVVTPRDVVSFLWLFLFHQSARSKDRLFGVI